MKTIVAAAGASLALAPSAGAAAPPDRKRAPARGTPNQAASTGPADKSALELKFARNGETPDRWTKLTTVSIVKIPGDDTSGATLGVITTFHDTLTARHVHVDRFDTAAAKPYTCYFEYHIGSERDKGIAYSPHAGFVTIAQVAEKLNDTITGDDVKTLKSIIGR